jgi:hypothetical protein
MSNYKPAADEKQRLEEALKAISALKAPYLVVFDEHQVVGATKAAETAKEPAVELKLNALTFEELPAHLALQVLAQKTPSSSWISMLKENDWTTEIRYQLEAHLKSLGITYLFVQPTRVPRAWARPTELALEWLRNSLGEKVKLIFFGAPSYWTLGFEPVVLPTLDLHATKAPAFSWLKNFFKIKETRDRFEFLLIEHCQKNMAQIDRVRDERDTIKKRDLDPITELQLSFLSMLRQIAPRIFLRAATTEVGAIELFALQSRATNAGTAGTSALLRRKKSVESERVFLLFQDSMSEDGLVARFASVRALRMHIRFYLEVIRGGAGTMNSQATTTVSHEIVTAWRKIFKNHVVHASGVANQSHVAELSESEVVERDRKLAVALRTAVQQIRTEQTYESDPHEYAWQLLALYEIFSDDKGDEESEKSKLAKRLEDVLEHRFVSDVYEKFDFLLMRARYAILRAQIAKAESLCFQAESLLSEVFIVPELQALAKLSLDWVKALIDDFQKVDRAKLQDEYSRIARKACDLGAFELQARVTYAALRSRREASIKDAETVKNAEAVKNARFILRVSNFINVQTLRAPELSGALKKQRLFISYRAETREFAKKLHALASKNDLDVYVEVMNCEYWEDQGASIQYALEEASMVLALISPNYFASYFCTHELDTVLSRKAFAGQKMRWLVIEDEASPSAENSFENAIKRIKQYIEKTLEQSPDPEAHRREKSRLEGWLVRRLDPMDALEGLVTVRATKFEANEKVSLEPMEGTAERIMQAAREVLNQK